uniref:Uncharacterized protein n=1 Tax=Avena sativa TaxID=4498 RepID=A0ACD5XK18_AVESA
MVKQQASRRATAAPPVRRRVEATTICFFEEAAPKAGGGHRFAVRVTCNVTRSLEFRRRGKRPDVLEQKYTAAGDSGGGAFATTFPVADLAALQSDDACRGALRGMLTELPQLRSLHLAEDEWDAVVPGDVVPEIVDAARRGDDGFTFCFTMSVHRRVIHNEQALLMACKERVAGEGELDGESLRVTADCAICFDGLDGESAVELPSCEHVFHRRCISKWFSKATTCPMCRGDVRLSALPEFLELSSTGEPVQGTTVLPDLE